MADVLQLASHETENLLLSCLISQKTAPAVALSLNLTRDDYGWEVNALIHDAITRIVEQGNFVDANVLIQELAKADHLSVIGGEGVVQGLTALPSDPAMLTQYIEIIRDRSMRRRVLSAFESGAQLLYSEPDGKKAVEGVQSHLYRAFDQYMASAHNGIAIGDLKNAWALREGVTELIAYPYDGMNKNGFGRERGTLNIWGGYSSDGKSTMALVSAIRSCIDGWKVALFSLEMTQEQLTVRILSYLTGIHNERIMAHEGLTDVERQLIESAFDRIQEWNLTIYCDPSLTPGDIRSIQMREKYDHIIIDYLQRFDYTDFHEVPRIAKQFKNLALSTLCTIDLLSQLTPRQTNPGVNPFTKPDNHSLYGGKATANEADNIFFIWAERIQDQYGGWVRTGFGMIIASKCRQGKSEWALPMRFDDIRIAWEET